MTTYHDLLESARTAIREASPAEADALRRAGALVVDVREQDEVDQGAIPGSLHIPRGYLEMRIE